MLGVGFGNNTASSPTNTDTGGNVLEQVLLADLPAPAEGISIIDPDFQVWVGGTRQVELSSSRALTTNFGNLAATSSTPLNSLDFVVDNYDAGDEIFITGTNADGSAVDVTFTVASGSTLGDLVNAISGAFTDATASLTTDGSLTLSPDSGSSTHQLSLALSDFQGNRYPVFQRLTEGATPIRVNFREILNRNIATLEQLRDKLNDIIQSEIASVTDPGTGAGLPPRHGRDSDRRGPVQVRLAVLCHFCHFRRHAGRGAARHRHLPRGRSDEAVAVGRHRPEIARFRRELPEGLSPRPAELQSGRHRRHRRRGRQDRHPGSVPQGGSRRASARHDRSAQGPRLQRTVLGVYRYQPGAALWSTSTSSSMPRRIWRSSSRRTVPAIARTSTTCASCSTTSSWTSRGSSTR